MQGGGRAIACFSSTARARHARYAGLAGNLRPAERATTGVRRSPGTPPGAVQAGTGVRLKLIVAPLLTRDLAQGPEVPLMVALADGLVGDRGFCSYAHLALPRAGWRARRAAGLGAPDRGLHARAALCQTACAADAAVTGVPRSRWLNGLGVHDQVVAWLTPTTCPSWRTREALATLADSFVRREVRYDVGTPGFRTRQITLVTMRLDAERDRVTDLAERYRQRWRVETVLAQLNTSKPMEVLHGNTVAAVYCRN
jgi:hypothetical protein